MPIDKPIRYLRKYFARLAITIQFLTKLNGAGFIQEISETKTLAELIERYKPPAFDFC